MGFGLGGLGREGSAACAGLAIGFEVCAAPVGSAPFPEALAVGTGAWARDELDATGSPGVPVAGGAGEAKTGTVDGSGTSSGATGAPELTTTTAGSTVCALAEDEVRKSGPPHPVRAMTKKKAGSRTTNGKVQYTYPRSRGDVTYTSRSRAWSGTRTGDGVLGVLTLPANVDTRRGFA